MATQLCIAETKIEWRDGPKLPKGLGAHAAFVSSEGIAVAGGTNWLNDQKTWRDEVWVLDEKTSTWQPGGKLPVGMAPTAAAHGEELVVLGGFAEEGSNGEAYRFAKGAVSKKLPNLPQPVAFAGTAVIGDDAFIIGGATEPMELKTAVDKVFRINLKSESPEYKPCAVMPAPCALMSTIPLGKRIYLFGGFVTADLDETLSYDVDKDRWEKLAPLPTARRGCAGVAIDDHRILVVGGCSGEKETLVMLDEVLIYDVRENRFEKTTPLPFGALCVAVVIKDGRIYVIGGEDRAKHRTDRVVIGELKKSE